MEYGDYDDESEDFFPEIVGDGRPEICRHCDYDCDEPDEDSCPLMGL